MKSRYLCASFSLMHIEKGKMRKSVIHSLRTNVLHENCKKIRE